MKGDTKIEFFSSGFRDVLMSSGVRSVLESTANDIAARADSGLTEDSTGHEVKVWQGSYGGGRLIASVSTTDKASAISEAENKTLSKAGK